jgi:acetoin utilization deacetylase AcuC-like enzyme
MWHDTGTAATVFPAGLTVEPGEHAENPATKRRLRHLIEVSGLIESLLPLKPRAATEQELGRFHTAEYIAKVKALSAVSGGLAGDFTPFGPGGYEIATLSAGGVIAAVEAVVRGEVDNAYALVRPPGHHAERDRGMGFCLFGNVAIAALHAREALGVSRIAIVDWDVHHGNGTQQAFYADPATLMISIHQDNLFPLGTGSVDETGEGAGIGYTLNVPLPPGSGHGAYRAAFEQVVVPALRAFEPELVLVSCGFDAGGADPLGRMMLHAGVYRAMTKAMMKVARECCGGKLVVVHEGGYSATHVPYCGLAVVEELSGVKTAIDDPWEPIMAQWGGQDLQAHQQSIIKRAAENLRLGLVPRKADTGSPQDQIANEARS